MLMTSYPLLSAPLAMASLVSKAFDGGGVGLPKGKPMTVHTLTPLPPEQLCRQRYMAGVDAYAGGEGPFGRFTQLGDLPGGGGL